MKKSNQENTAEEIIERITAKIEQVKARSAWERGVRDYALDLVKDLHDNMLCGWHTSNDFSNRQLMEKAMLNGAKSWSQYSKGGCSLCYDGQIAERLCAPWELRKTDNGRKAPNPRESWLDVQSCALSQAARLVLDAAFSEI